VIIAGTGSQASLIISPSTQGINSLNDIKIFSVGGWGNILGDEGSGIF
jgi:N-acetylglucosamine kinase-like BadF-type ATPase